MYLKCVANIYISALEGFGFPPLVAAVNNKVSVVANKGGLPEIYGNTVYYVDPLNLEEIKNALSTVASPLFNADDYKNKFPPLIRKFNWNDTASKIMYIVLESVGINPQEMYYKDIRDPIFKSEGSF
jgi:glycosyltransferase involved in cell wall biosynthesis